ncbi:chaplin [Streptomyces sp. NPDC005876]|jgi:hypothetical protein|uniref:chaplin n=1 Tax=unclassified Streptomyces TaxID=2593676 RepID=UPI0033C306C0
MSRITRVLVLTSVAATTLTGTAGAAVAHGGGGAGARAVTTGSHGESSGNVLQTPVAVPVNVCGNTVNLVGLLNPAFGNKCR